MRSVFIALAFAMTIQLKAEVLQVNSLNEGSCWVSHENGQTKLAIFAEGKTFILSKEEFVSLEEKMTKALQKENFQEFPMSAYEVYLHCASQDASLVVNLYEGENPLCFHMQMTSPNHLQLQAVYSNYEGGKGPCQGLAKGILIWRFMKGVSATDMAECRDRITSDQKEYVARGRLIPGGLVLELRSSYFLRENIAKEYLQKQDLCPSVLLENGLDYGPIMVPVGHDFKLKTGNFNGF